MRILACFLLCSLIGGVSEVLFAAAMDFIKARYGRSAQKPHHASAPSRSRPRFEVDVASRVESNTDAMDRKSFSEEVAWKSCL